jgi:lysozyme family protein
MDFMTILQKTLKWEGTWSDDAVDAGGKTMLGITQATLGAWLGRPASAQEIRNLTRDEAINIYQSMYFQKPGINLLPDALQSPVFDFGVNAGPGRAIMGLQTLIDTLGIVPHINVDGGIGAFTLKAVSGTLGTTGERKMVNAYQDARQAFYNGIVLKDESQREFLRGWTNRVDDFRIT